ncbi:MAG: tetratricopeptide repeat-containing sensor histidine kinase [Candidatus Kapabacteria bacterium]|nr:tetratricopeptide repeat-containing sensor histidine kinase [Ignavibacteriota bacterium]MCW5883801.1 tetratricopeptide repeat-containing sensor histidine kinase [Candidatus Kapabacteria bacterium]
MSIYYFINIVVVVFFLSITALKSQSELQNYDTLPKDIKTVDKLLEYCDNIDNIDSNIIYANTALKISESINYTLGAAKALHSLASSHYYFADYEKALFFLKLEIEIYLSTNSINNSDLLGESYRFSGEVYRAQKDYDNALRYLEKAETIFHKTQNQFLLSKTYNRYAAVILEQTGYAKDQRVPDYIHKSDEIAKKYNYYDIIANNINIYASYSQFYVEYDEIIANYKSAIEYLKKFEQPSEIPNIYRNLAYAYRNGGKIDSALYYAHKSYEISKKYNINVYIYNSVGLLYSIYHEDLNNNDSAIVYLKYMIEYEGLMYDAEKMLYQTQMEYKFKSQIKDDEIKSQKVIMFYQILISIVLIIILAGIGYFFYFRAKHQKLANEIINKQKEELDELNSAKDKFFSIIAHDLRNPVSSFQNITSMMYDDYQDFSDSEKHDILRLLKESANNLSSLLENLLTWSRSQSGKINYEPDSYNINYIINNIIQEHQSIAKNKNINFINNLKADTKAYYDASLINIAIRNIVSNSLKFSPNDSNIYFYSETIVESNNEFLQIEIKDEGVGMSPTQVQNIFSLDKNKSTKGSLGEKGTGLGMILVHEFIIKNQGKIWIESEIGKGTSVYIQLPVKKY